MIKTLFLHDLREHKFLIISFTAILLVYGTISVSMFDPESSEIMQQMLDLMPPTLISMMGFENLGTEITSYVANYLYGFINILFPIIYMIMIGNRLVCRYVDNNSMQFIVTTPYSRVKIITTQAVFYILSLLFILWFNFIVVIVMSESMFPGLLKMEAFISLSFLTTGIHLLLAGITFFISSFFNDSSYTVGTSGGLLFAFFILNMLRKIDESVSFLRFFTPFSLIDIERIIDTPAFGWANGLIILFAGIGVFVGSIVYFNKKSLII